MTVKEERASYSIERKEAASILGVSLRTIDRYIKSGKLTAQKVGYHVYLARKDIEDMQQSFVTQVVPDPIEEDEIRTEDFLPTQQQSSHEQEGLQVLMYKGLCEHMKQELEVKDKQLQQMHYRLGELETKLATAVPLLTYEEERQKTDGLLQDLDQEAEHMRKTVKEQASLLDLSKRQKTAYMVLSMSLLLLLVILGVVLIPILT